MFAAITPLLVSHLAASYFTSATASFSGLPLSREIMVASSVSCSPCSWNKSSTNRHRSPTVVESRQPDSRASWAASIASLVKGAPQLGTRAITSSVDGSSTPNVAAAVAVAAASLLLSPSSLLLMTCLHSLSRRSDRGTGRERTTSRPLYHLGVFSPHRSCSCRPKPSRSNPSTWWDALTSS